MLSKCSVNPSQFAPRSVRSTRLEGLSGNGSFTLRDGAKSALVHPEPVEGLSANGLTELIQCSPGSRRRIYFLMEGETLALLASLLIFRVSCQYAYPTSSTFLTTLCFLLYGSGLRPYRFGWFF